MLAHGGPGRQPARHGDDRAAGPDARLREQGRAEADHVRASDAIQDELRAGWIELGTVNGKLYGLDFKGANKSTVWYNVRAFKDAGVEAAEDVAAAPPAAKTLQASGIQAYSIGGADGWTLTDLFENIYLRTAGPAKYDLLATHKIKWTDRVGENGAQDDGAGHRRHGQHRRRHAGGARRPTSRPR